ncbi:MAG: ABC transporter ATP-binding protein [Acidobacteria bacterium]|nr:ABC transporter ATP-binding protein [Acidobacteriota bacterium]
MTGDTAFRLERVSAGYPGRSPVLKDVSLTLQRGTVTALLGENGSGKSTLLRVLAGLLSLRAGTVELQGRPAADHTRRERAGLLGYLPQGFVPFFPATAREVVLLGRTPHLRGFSAPSRADHAAVESALALVDAGALAEVDVLRMSGGERQRVLLARVLAGGHDVLLLDEPTANLDPRHRLLVAGLLSEHARRGGTVLVSTHELDDARACATHAALRAGGRLTAFGTRTEILAAGPLGALYGVPAFEARLEGGGSTVILGAPR